MISLSALVVAAALAQATTPAPAFVIIEPFFYFDSGASRHRPQIERNYKVLLDHALRPNVTAIVVSAHTDTVGSAADNIVLSERRGRDLADVMIARGVSPDLIRIEALGETRLPRPTADGVDEPLNRHVWVNIRVRD